MAKNPHLITSLVQRMTTLYINERMEAIHSPACRSFSVDNAKRLPSGYSSMVVDAARSLGKPEGGSCKREDECVRTDRCSA